MAGCPRKKFHPIYRPCLNCARGPDAVFGCTWQGGGQALVAARDWYEMELPRSVDRVMVLMRAHRRVTHALKKDIEHFEEAIVELEKEAVWTPEGSIATAWQTFSTLKTSIMWKEAACDLLEKKHAVACTVALRDASSLRPVTLFHLCEFSTSHRAIMACVTPSPGVTGEDRRRRFRHRVAHTLGNVSRISSALVVGLPAFIVLSEGTPRRERFEDLERKLKKINREANGMLHVRRS